MRISRGKTEVMFTGRNQETIDIENTVLHQTSEFVYFSSTITDDGKLDREIDKRCCKANQVLGQLAPILQHTRMPCNTKRALIQSIFIPTLCY